MPDLATASTAIDDRLGEILELHLHPEFGSTYWLARQERLGWSICDRVRTLDDLSLLGRTSVEDLRRYPVDAFIPRGLYSQRNRFILGETAGTSGEPCTTAYRDDEFQAAFVTPFLRVAAATGFPHGATWLWIGPSGPHIIGKAARELARQTGSMDPFSVDFDPRWAKRLAEGSLARRRYLEHVVSQARDVFERQGITVLFTTPPILAALSGLLGDRDRDAIRGVHYGGISLSAADVNRFRAAFPRAVHLAGYGNTLFGVVMEVEDRQRTAIDYFPLGNRVHFRVVAEPDEETVPVPVARGQTGRVLFHRLDESCLLVNVVERDEADRIAASSAARALGGQADGLRNPRPPAALARRLQVGLY
jgi:hypothetical protein